jgi:hypothetical protein
MTTEHKTKLLIVDDLPENLQALEKIIETDDRLIWTYCCNTILHSRFWM